MKTITFLTIAVASLFNAAYALGLDGLTDTVTGTGALQEVGGGLLGGASKAKADPQSVDDSSINFKKMRRNFVAKKRELPVAGGLPVVGSILGGEDKAKPASAKDDDFPGSQAFKDAFPSGFEDSKPKSSGGLGAGLLDKLPAVGK